MALSVEQKDSDLRFKYFSESIYSLKEKEIFVFGSNFCGVHGAGAAKIAKDYFKAVWGVSEGFTGQCYAIPTKDLEIKTLPLEVIQKHVDRFVDWTYIRKDLTFLVTAIGTGLAGYSDHEMAVMFKYANSSNCVFDIDWKPFLETA